MGGGAGSPKTRARVTGTACVDFTLVPIWWRNRTNYRYFCYSQLNRFFKCGWAGGFGWPIALSYYNWAPGKTDMDSARNTYQIHMCVIGIWTTLFAISQLRNPHHVSGSWQSQILFARRGTSHTLWSTHSRTVTVVMYVLTNGANTRRSYPEKQRDFYPMCFYHRLGTARRHRLLRQWLKWHYSCYCVLLNLKMQSFFVSSLSPLLG